MSVCVWLDTLKTKEMLKIEVCSASRKKGPAWRRLDLP